MNAQEQWRALLRATSQPAASAELAGLLQQAVRLGSQLTPEAVSCSITEMDGGNTRGVAYRTPVYSDQLALDLDRAQYQAGDGPCMAAAREQQRQNFDATVDGTRFPGFTEAAIGRGVRSSISLPLPLGSPHRSAAINLYASSRHAFEAEQPRAAADLLARCVSILLNSDDASRAAEKAADASLQAARARARLIADAEAVLMATHSVDRPDAMAILIRRSKAERRSVFQIAAELVATEGVTR
ncbi:MAG: hypothetical protein QOE23_982 [Pseudonocardiales bacterium]|nr:hypothetical protein [Pseudonocardiales bacterium]